jgi:hypothetical protein
MQSKRFLGIFFLAFAIVSLSLPELIYGKEPQHELMKTAKEYYLVVAGISGLVGFYILSDSQKPSEAGESVLAKEVSSDTVSSGLLDIPNMEQVPSYEYATTST